MSGSARGQVRWLTDIAADSPVRSRRFIQMLAARLMSGIAVNALHYALIIETLRRTNSTFAVSLMVFTFTAPGVVTGLLAGVAVDRFPRRPLLIAAHLARAAVCLAFFRFSDLVGWLFLLSFLFSTVNPLANPAEYAIMPSLVRSHRITSGNAWFNLTTLAGNVIGVGILAPLFLLVVGVSPLYLLAVVLYAVAALLVLQMGHIRGAGPGDGSRMRGVADVRRDLLQVLTFLRTDRPAYRAMIDVTLMQATVLVLASVLPTFVRDVLGISAGRAVFVFAPAAVGTAVGLKLAAPLARHFGNAIVVTTGITLLVASCLALGFVDQLAVLAEGGGRAVEALIGVPLLGPSPRVAAAMVTAFPLGLASASVAVAARAVLHERAPAQLHGRLFAVQGVLSSLAALAPLLLGGLLADWLDVRLVLLLLGAAAMGAGLYTRLKERSDSRDGG